MASGLSRTLQEELRFKLFWTGSNAGFAFFDVYFTCNFNNALAVGRSDAFADITLANTDSNSLEVS